MDYFTVLRHLVDLVNYWQRYLTLTDGVAFEDTRAECRHIGSLDDAIWSSKKYTECVTAKDCQKLTVSVID